VSWDLYHPSVVLITIIHSRRRRCRESLSWPQISTVAGQTEGRGWVAGTSERVGAGIGVGVMVGNTSPNAFSTLEHQWWVKGGEPIASLRTSRGLPHHGSPLVFSTCPQLIIPSETHQNRRRVAYIPHWRGEARWQRVWVWRNLERMK